MEKNEIYQDVFRAIISLGTLEGGREDEWDKYNRFFGRELSDLHYEVLSIRELFRDFETGETVSHMENTALKGLEIADYLEIGHIEVSERGNARQAMFISGLVHDRGKGNIKMRETFKKSERIRKGSREKFSEKDRQNIREHVLASVNLERDLFIKGIIARHHCYQPNHYPEIPCLSYKEEKYGEKSPQTAYLSKLLAILDFYDRERDRKKMIDFYSELKFGCNGLPKLAGKELINELYEKGIFNHCNLSP